MQMHILEAAIFAFFCGLLKHCSTIHCKIVSDVYAAITLVARLQYIDIEIWEQKQSSVYFETCDTERIDRWRKSFQASQTAALNISPSGLATKISSLCSQLKPGKIYHVIA